MKKILFCLFLFYVLLPVAGYAAQLITLSDDTLVTDPVALRGLAKGYSKALICNGSIGDTFAVTEDGVLVRTITLAATSEKWVFWHTSTSFKVNWSAPGTDTASLLLAGE